MHKFYVHSTSSLGPAWPNDHCCWFKSLAPHHFRFESHMNDAKKAFSWRFGGRLFYPIASLCMNSANSNTFRVFSYHYSLKKAKIFMTYCVSLNFKLTKKYRNQGFFVVNIFLSLFFRCIWQLRILQPMSRSTTSVTNIWKIKMATSTIHLIPAGN